MPSSNRPSCPPLPLDIMSTNMDLQPARHQTNILSLKPHHHRDQAQVCVMVEDVVRLRALLHQSAVSWTRRHRAMIR